MNKANSWLSEAKVSLQKAPALEVANARKEVGPRGRKKTSLFNRRLNGIRKRAYVKAKSGRGKMRQHWVEELYDELRKNFTHSRKACIKVNHAVIRAMYLTLVRNTPEGTSFHHLEKYSVFRKPIATHINIPFVKRFYQAKYIVQRSKAGKLM